MTPLEQFGLAVLEESREEFGDLDGGWIQDEAEKLGLLICVEAIEQCGENCRCVEWDNFPQDCYRYSPEVQKMVEEK